MSDPQKSSPQGKRKAAHSEALIGRSLQHGEYQIEAVLGRGGMGQVFLASHTKLDVPVALKQVRADQPLPESVITELDRILHNEGTEPYIPSGQAQENDFPVSGGANTDRFLREALLLARLRHPAIPLLYDYFFEEGYWYLTMEYVPGPTLAAYMREHAPLPPLEALNYAMQLCDVLDYLHQQMPPVIFRDMKPSNVILNPDGRLMLIDFGIARYFKEGQINDTTDFGSPGYASPEQYEGIGQTDARSDLFSLGVILHEMVSGQPPVRRAARGWKMEMLHKINPAISPALSGLVMVATRTEPMYRFQTAHTFYAALERTHTIEERWAYRRCVFLAEEAQRQQVSGPSGNTESRPALVADQKLKEPAAATSRTQRMHLREHAYETRREQLEQEALAHQLAFVDESLKQRAGASGVLVASQSLRPLPPLPPPLPSTLMPPPEEFESVIPARSTRRSRHIFSTFIALVIVLALLAALLLTYNYSINHAYPAQPVQTIHATQPAQTAHSTVIPSSAWQVLPALPAPEADNTALYTEVQGRAYIYMSGGYRGARNLPHYSHGLYRYDIAAAHWESLTIKGLPGMGNNAAALDKYGRLFFTAGYSPDSASVPSLLYMYQPDNGKLTAITPPPQTALGFGGAMVADQQGHLYLTEGFMTPANPATLAGSGWYSYDSSTGQWRVLASLPIGLGYVQLVPDGTGGILLLGGARDAGQHLPSHSIYRYDVSQNVWTQALTTTPSVLSGAASCLNGPRQFVIIGGYDAAHNRSLASVWLLDPGTLRWASLPSLPTGGSALGAAACDGQGHVYVERGANNSNSPTADFLELSIT